MENVEDEDFVEQLMDIHDKALHHLTLQTSHHWRKLKLHTLRMSRDLDPCFISWYILNSKNTHKTHTQLSSIIGFVTE